MIQQDLVNVLSNVYRKSSESVDILVNIETMKIGLANMLFYTTNENDKLITASEYADHIIQYKNNLKSQLPISQLFSIFDKKDPRCVILRKRNNIWDKFKAWLQKSGGN